MPTFKNTVLSTSAIIILLFWLNVKVSHGSASFKEIEAHPDRVRVTDDGLMHFTLHPGDYVNNGTRSMMREKFPLKYPKNTWIYYDFSVQIDSDWPYTTNNDALIVQWRNGYGSPYFAVHLQNGKFYVRRASKPVKKYYPESKLLGKNRFHVEAKWSEKENGRFIMFINNEKFIDYEGRTLMNEMTPFVSFGLYRPKWNGMRFDPDTKLTIEFDSFEYGLIDKKE